MLTDKVNLKMKEKRFCIEFNKQTMYIIAYYVYPIRFEDRITKKFHILAKHSHTYSVYLLSM